MDRGCLGRLFLEVMFFISNYFRGIHHRGHGASGGSGGMAALCARYRGGMTPRRPRRAVSPLMHALAREAGTGAHQGVVRSPKALTVIRFVPDVRLTRTVLPAWKTIPVSRWT